MKHIIIEGPDGAGKTQLARQLCHRHQMAYHHEGPPPTDGSLLHHYAALLMNATRPTVFDRLHVGELVYGPLLRGESQIKGYELELMNRLVRGLGVATVVCLPPWPVCWDNNQRKPELIPTRRGLEVAYDKWTYIVTMPETLANLQTYDYTSGDVFVVNQPDRLPDGVIGSPHARFLFVGEQPNGNSLDLPFFGDAPSSLYLNGRITDAGFQEADIAFTNALDVVGQARDLAFIVSQMPRLETVVTLGRVALAQFERQQPPFVKLHAMPHPQYWKRFHHGETREYTRMLENLHDVA